MKKGYHNGGASEIGKGLELVFPHDEAGLCHVFTVRFQHRGITTVNQALIAYSIDNELAKQFSRRHAHLLTPINGFPFNIGRVKPHLVVLLATRDQAFAISRHINDDIRVIMSPD